MLLVLVLPLSAAAGLTFELVALAIGRYPAMRVPLPQRRWRFTSGRVLYAVLQGIAGCVLGFHAEEYFFGPLLLAAAIYLVSLYLGGRAWDGQVRRVAVARAAAKAA